MNSPLPDLPKPLPLVTVITVTYNSSLYIRDAIESVLTQPYPNFEYIIADDCSTDNTWDIINEYKDSRIKKYRNETNLKEYPNRNKAVTMASGDYVVFVDGEKTVTLKGDNISKEFQAIVEDYVHKNYAAGGKLCVANLQNKPKTIPINALN